VAPFFFVNIGFRLADVLAFWVEILVKAVIESIMGIGVRPFVIDVIYEV